MDGECFEARNDSLLFFNSALRISIQLQREEGGVQNRESSDTEQLSLKALRSSDTEPRCTTSITKARALALIPLSLFVYILLHF